MHKLTDLDREIYRAERRLNTLRDELNVNLEASRLGVWKKLSSPKALLGAVAVGFLLDRMSRRKKHVGDAGGMRASGMSGIAAGLAAAALRAAISNPSMWRGVRQWWSTRKAEVPAAIPKPTSTAGTTAEVRPLRAANR